MPCTSRVKQIVKTEGILDYVNKMIYYVSPRFSASSFEEILTLLLSLGLLFGSRVRIILAQFPLVLCSRVSLYPPPTAGVFYPYPARCAIVGEFGVARAESEGIKTINEGAFKENRKLLQKTK